MTIAVMNSFTDEPITPLTHKTYNRASYLSVCPECSSNVIPGLDAVTCVKCRVLLIDREETEKFYKRKKEGAYH